MIDLKVAFDGLDDVKAELSGIREQIPYATSRAINAVLDDIQTAVRSTLPSEFHVRAPEWLDRTIYIAPQDRAKKDDLNGTVRVNPDRDVLAKFEDETVKTPRSAANLAIPIFRESAPDLVVKRGDPLSLKNIMASLQKSTGRVKKKRGLIGPQQLQTVFLAKTARGTVILERTGATTRVLYAFKPSVPIKPDLRFDETAMTTAVAMWEQRAQEALDLAISTAK